jgi:hypothetical protein
VVHLFGAEDIRHIDAGCRTRHNEVADRGE